MLLLINEKLQNITICEQTNEIANSKCHIAKVTKSQQFVLVSLGNYKVARLSCDEYLQNI